MKEFILIICRCGRVKSYEKWQWAFKEFSAVLRDLMETKYGGIENDYIIKFLIDVCDYCRIKMMKKEVN